MTPNVNEPHRTPVTPPDPPGFTSTQETTMYDSNVHAYAYQAGALRCLARFLCVQLERVLDHNKVDAEDSVIILPGTMHKEIAITLQTAYEQLEECDGEDEEAPSE